MSCVRRSIGAPKSVPISRSDSPAPAHPSRKPPACSTSDGPLPNSGEKRAPERPFSPNIRETVQGVDEAAEGSRGEAVVAEDQTVEIEVVVAADLGGQRLAPADASVGGDRSELFLNPPQFLVRRALFQRQHEEFVHPQTTAAGE